MTAKERRKNRPKSRDRNVVKTNQPNTYGPFENIFPEGWLKLLQADGTLVDVGTGGGASALDDLTDVNAPTPADRDALFWDDVAGEWISDQIEMGDVGGLVSALAGKSDIGHTHGAAEIGSGTVSDTEFGYLDGVTSAIQTQLNGKAASSHTHPESDITGLTSDLAAKEATANKGAASGYASLDSGSKVPIAQLPTGSSSSTVCIGDDSRLSDTRTPTDNTVATAKIQNNAVDDTKLRDGSATSVIGRSANSTGDPADIAASADGQYLTRRSGALSFATIQASDLPTSIDAAKIADGSVSNAEYQRLDGVTSGIQSQLDTKIDTTSNSGTGDGTILKARSATTIIAKKLKKGSHINMTDGTDEITITGDGDADSINGKTVSAPTPSEGQVLKYSGGQWINSAPAFGGDTSHAGFTVSNANAETVTTSIPSSGNYVSNTVTSVSVGNSAV